MPSIASYVRVGAALAALLIAITPHRADAQFDVLSKKMTDKIGSVGAAPAPAKPAPAKSRAKPAPKAAEEQGAGAIPGTLPDTGLRADSVAQRKSTAHPRHPSSASPKRSAAKAPRRRTGERAPSPPGRTAPPRAQ